MTLTPIVIAGPTGTGKSELALQIALAIGGEIVNYDSVQLYRGFDIGSAKPSPETRAQVPHHLFDIIDADVDFNAAEYSRLARDTCKAIEKRGNRPILAGGTFFYLRALLHGLPEMPGRDADIRARIRRIAGRPRGAERLHRWLSKIDPRSAGKIAPADRHRIERALEVWMVSGRAISEWTPPAPAGDEVLAATKIGLTMDRAGLTTRLDERVDAMYAAGLVEETRTLLTVYPRTARPFGAIGYAEAVAAIAGELDLETAIAQTKRRTRAYAKRQMTWLRSERNVQWIEASTIDETFAAAMRLLEETKWRRDRFWF